MSKRSISQPDISLSADVKHKKAALVSKHIKYCMRYIPAAIHRNIRQGATEFAEVRDLTVLFITVPDVDLYMNGDVEAGANIAQELMSRMQDAIYHYEGSVNKFLVDDKGLMLLAAFGMPPLAHLDDPSRAVAAAFDIVHSLNAVGFPCQIGVTTGRVFCGICGSMRCGRCEYTLLGDSVNLASRLMCKAEIGGILVDTITRNESELEFLYDEEQPLILKGKALPTPVFRPTGPTARLCSLPEVAVEATEQAAGNWSALGELREKLTDMSNNGGGVLMIDGQQGCGKTELMTHIGALSRSLDLVHFDGKNQGPRNANLPPDEPLMPFASLLISLICGYHNTQLIVDDGVDQCCLMLLELVSRMVPPASKHNIKMLIPIFRTWLIKFDQRFEDARHSAIPTAPTPPKYYERQRDVIFEVIRFHVRKVPTLILFRLEVGNNHKAVPLSDVAFELLFQLAGLAHENVATMDKMSTNEKPPPPLVLCIAGKISLKEHPTDLERQFHENKVTLRVKPLPPERAELILAKFCKALAVAPEVATFLFQTAAGNFKQIRDISEALLQSKALILKGTTAVFSEEAREESLYWTANNIPKIVPKGSQRFWIAMFDQLDPFEKWIMKLCAVIISHSPDHVVSASSLQTVMNVEEVRKLTVETVGAGNMRQHFENGCVSVKSLGMVLEWLADNNWLRPAHLVSYNENCISLLRICSGENTPLQPEEQCQIMIGRTQSHALDVLAVNQAPCTVRLPHGTHPPKDYVYQVYLLQVLVEAGFPETIRQLLLAKIRDVSSRLSSGEDALEKESVVIQVE